MAIALIIFLVVFLCWPMIMRWVKAFMARRAEDFIRSATGMPPRPGSREDKRRQRSQDGASSARRSSQSRRRSRRSGADEPIIPREYAEDVEFVETKDYSETTIGTIDESGRKTVHYHESQVSDAEWEEIKSGPRKK